MLASPTTELLLQEMASIVISFQNPDISLFYKWVLRQEFQNLRKVAYLYTFSELQQQRFDDLLSKFISDDMGKPLLRDF